MPTRHIVPSKTQTHFYRWLPVSYLFLFGGALLISLWAELNRRQQLSKPQTICSCDGANALSTTATGYAPSLSAPKTHWWRGNKWPVVKPCDLIPVENLKLYG